MNMLEPIIVNKIHIANNVLVRLFAIKKVTMIHKIQLSQRNICPDITALHLPLALLVDVYKFKQKETRTKPS